MSDPFQIDNRLNSVLHGDEAERAMRGLLAAVPSHTWLRREANLRTRWPIFGLPAIVADRHALELTIADAIRQHAATGLYVPSLGHPQATAVAFAHVLQYVSATSTTAADYCRRKIDDGMKGAHSLRPLAFELRTLLHAVNKGFEVVPSEIAGTSSHDFTAKKSGFSIMVECKAVDANTGMAIKAEEVGDTAEALWRRRHDLFVNGGSSHLHLQLKSEPQRGRAVDWSGEALSFLKSGETESARLFADYRFKRLGAAFVAQWRQLHANEQDPVKLKAGLLGLLGVPQEAHAVVRYDGGHLFILTLASHYQPDVMSTVFKRLRNDAKRQLPAGIAGCLMVEMSALLPDDELFFHDRGPEDRLRLAVSDLFRRRDHVLALTFVSGRARSL